MRFLCYHAGKNTCRRGGICGRFFFVCMISPKKEQILPIFFLLVLCCCGFAAAEQTSDASTPRFRNPMRAMSERYAQPVNIRISPAWGLTDAQRRTALQPPVMVPDAKRVRLLYPEDIEPTAEQKADGSALTVKQRSAMKSARRAAMKEAVWRVSVEAEACNRANAQALAAIEKKGRHVIINLTEQRGYYMEGSTMVRSFQVCTGKRSTPTPTGHFHVMEKDRHHRSNLYNAAMPFFMRLTLDGVGLHQGPIRSTPASHGCIRLPGEAAAFLFEKCEVGTGVFVVK